MRQLLRQLTLLREAVRQQPPSTARTIQLSQITTIRLQLALDRTTRNLALLDALLQD